MSPQDRHLVRGVSLAQGQWRVLNDDVMGGVSQSSIATVQDGVRFQGKLSFENGGGFASIRLRYTADLDDVDLIRLRLRGDGRGYYFILRLLAESPRLSWRIALPSSASWRDVELPLAAFLPKVRGQPLPASGPMVAGVVRELGLLLADGQRGPFRLDIAAIEFVDRRRLSAATPR